MLQSLSAFYSVSLGIDGSADKQEGVVHLLALTPLGDWHLDTYRAKTKKESAAYHFTALAAGKRWMRNIKVVVGSTMSDACNTMICCGSMVIAKLTIGANKCLAHAAQNVLKVCLSDGEMFEENVEVLKNMTILHNAISAGKLRNFMNEFEMEYELQMRMQRKHSEMVAGSAEYDAQYNKYVDRYNKRHGLTYANRFLFTLCVTSKFG